MPSQLKKPPAQQYKTAAPLRLCEANGVNGWLRRYTAPGQALPSYNNLKARAYDGEFVTVVVGRFRCIAVADVPDLLAAFDLVPAVETEAA